MTREEFEGWLDDHRDEALDRVDPQSLTLSQWRVMYGKALKCIAEEESEGDDEEPEDLYEDDADPLDFEEEV